MIREGSAQTTFGKRRYCPHSSDRRAAGHRDRGPPLPYHRDAPLPESIPIKVPCPTQSRAFENCTAQRKTQRLIHGPLRVAPEGLIVSAGWAGVLTGCVDGAVGPDVSKTEEIKASVAWVSSRNHAMIWCFRCAFSVAPHGARADLLRFGHLARSMRRADTRAGPPPERGEADRAGALEGA